MRRAQVNTAGNLERALSLCPRHSAEGGLHGIDQDFAGDGLALAVVALGVTVLRRARTLGADDVLAALRGLASVAGLAADAALDAVAGLAGAAIVGAGFWSVAARAFEMA